MYINLNRDRKPIVMEIHCSLFPWDPDGLTFASNKSDITNITEVLLGI